MRDFENLDKRFIGQWQREDDKRVLSISQDGENVGVKISWLPDGAFNWSAEYSECDGNTLDFFHNDRYNRAEYILTLTADNLLSCEFTQVGMTKEPLILNYVKTSEIPYDIEFTPPVPMKETGRIDILKEYADYGDEVDTFKFDFNFDERENMLDIIEKYNLDELVEGKNDAETAIALMNWMCGLYKHGNPAGGLARISTPQELMKFADEADGRTNCRGLSLMLVQLIRAYNIKAFHVTCLPYEQPFDDCHVVVCVYCENLGKLIMLDPSSNIYFKNKDGELLGVSELRDFIINDRADELVPNDDWFTLNWYTGIIGNNSYSEYMAKNLIRIERYNDNGYGIDMRNGAVILVPEKYLLNEAKNINLETGRVFTSSKDAFWQT